MSKYTQENLDDMKSLLAESEFEGLRDGDLIQILIDGCEGYDALSDDELIEHFENVFDEDYFEVQDEKDDKNGLYGESL